jgi:dihydrolipoamide dehydrogenase
MLDEIVPAMDRGLAATLRRALKSVDFRLGSKVEAIDGGKISFSRGGAAESIEADLILMAIGRKPNVEGIGARESGLDAGPAGIAVDEGMRTNLPGVWAIGDVTGKSYLAHSAIRMGEVAIANILGRNEAMRYEAVPWAVYSAPEAAGVGMTEAEARARGLDAVCATASFSSSGRFIAENGLAAPGELKLVADARNGRVLGVQAVGAYASESIWGAAALIEQEMRIVDLRQLIFPHPTVSEVLREAAWRL